MTEPIVGVLHPGEMGAGVAGCLAARGLTVLWASPGRGPDTAVRAARAGLRDAGSLAELAQQCDIVLSICPPHAALEVARLTAGHGFGGTYVDANAVSPTTVRLVAESVEAGGATFTDGAVIGMPPGPDSTPRLYLSGARAGRIQELFAGTAVTARVVDGGAGAASAVKMAYGAWSKGTAALVLAARALARAEGVEGALLAEWAESQPGLEQRSQSAARSARAKGWRWTGEMEEIAAAMAAVGLPPQFHEAAAEVYRRQDRGSGAAPEDAEMDEVLGHLLGRGTPGGR